MSAPAIMSGVFATWQPQYAKFGLPTFPVEGKKPLIRGYPHLGLKGSAALVHKFPGAQSFGLITGKRTTITVLDIDSTDEALLAEALRQQGDTPFVVRTGSGHFQAWYRHGGERRLIRPFGDLPVDILGDRGFVVAPPSRTGLGYEIVRGSLADLSRLPTMQRSSIKEVSGRRIVPNGIRNNSMFSFALRQARHVDDEDTLLDKVRTESDDSCQTLMEPSEVVRLTKSAWRYQTERRNFTETSSVVTTFGELDELTKTAPDALVLLLWLRRNHGKRSQFALGKAAAEALFWSLPRFRKARAYLETTRRIKCLSRGGKGPKDPPLYSLQK